MWYVFFFFFSSRRRHTRCSRDWSSDVCSSDLTAAISCPAARSASRLGTAKSGVPMKARRSLVMVRGVETQDAPVACPTRPSRRALRALLSTRINDEPHPEEARSAVSKDEWENATTFAEIAACG